MVKMMNKENVSIIQKIKKFLWETRYIIIFFIIGDVATTLYAGSHGGQEFNVVALTIMNHYGGVGLIASKLFFLSMLYFVYKAIDETNQWSWTIARRSIEFIGLFVTVNNLMVIYCSYSILQVLGVI